MKIKLPNKNILVISAILLLCFCMCISACISAVATHRELKALSARLFGTTETPSISTPMIASDAIYRLYECGGKIGIYDAKTGILVDIIDVFVSTLPANDRLTLKKGIDIFAFSELTSIIEDFTS